MKAAPTWTFTTTEREGFLEIAITGEVTVEAARDLEAEVFAVVEAKGAKALLVDVRGLKGRFGVVDAYHRVRAYRGKAPGIRTAVVDRQEHEALGRFYEDTSYNIGRIRRHFTNLEDARAWLRDPTT